VKFRSLAIAGAGTLCFLLAGCIGGRPIHYYTINSPALPEAAPKPDGPVLLIGRISTPEALEDERIRYRAGSNEVGAYELDRWMERPAMMVQDLLLRVLRDSGKFRQVVELSSSVTGDYLVRGRLSEFAEIDNPGIRTRISLRLEMVDRKTGSPVWAQDYDRDEPVNGKTMRDVVLSMERNLQKVVGDAASAIEAAQHTTGPGH